MKKTMKKVFMPFAIFAFSLGLSISFNIQNRVIETNATDYIGNTYLWNASGMVNAEVLVSKDLDTNWKISGSKNDASTEATYYTTGEALRVYGASGGNGGHLLVEPTAANTNKVLTKIEFISYTGYIPAIKIFTGNTLVDLSEVTGQAFNGTTFTYTYTNASGFKFFKIQNAVTGATTQIRVKQINFDYKDDTTVYDPVTSLASNITSPVELFIGEELVVSPTILPSSANQNFTLSTESLAVSISGSKITGVSIATGVEVTITTVGKASGDVSLTEVFTVNVLQATTTVAEALTLTPDGKIIYLIEDAIISDGYNTTYDRQIQLVDTTDSEKFILIFKYGINPMNSYRYIAGGTISFKATLGAYSGVNQFTNPIIIDYSDDVEVFADSILVGDTEGQCNTRFADYKTTVLSFSAIENSKFQNGTDTNIITARARYLAWATALGENPYTAGTSGSLNVTNQQATSYLWLIIATFLLGILLSVSYRRFNFKKR